MLSDEAGGAGDSVPLCLSPRWRLKGDRCLDTVPRLNDWNGMEGGTKVNINQVTFCFQGDASRSQGGVKTRGGQIQTTAGL